MEMYNMLLGISSELERIKYELAKSENLTKSDRIVLKEFLIVGNKGYNTSYTSHFSYENLNDQVD